MAESHRQLVDGRGKRPAQVLSLVFGKRAYRSSLSCPPSPGHATSSTTTHRAQGVEGALPGFVLPLLISRWMGVTGRHEQLNLTSVFLAAMKVVTTL